MVLTRAKQRLLAEHAIEAQLDDGTYVKPVSLSGLEFADDCTGVTVCKREQDLQTSMQILSEEFTKYFESHGLKINVSKSEHMVLGGPRKLDQVVIDGRKEARKVKLLGITFTNTYTFEDHVTKVCSKMAARNGQLVKLKPYADIKTMKMLANSVVVSVATYGSEIYGVDKSQVNKVQVKMNQTMRNITGSGLRRHIKDMLTQLRWLNFPEMIMYGKIILVNKIMSSNVSPFCLMLMIKAMNDRQQRYQTRERDLRIAWRVRTQRRGDKSFLVSALKLYNFAKVAGRGDDLAEFKEIVKDKILSWRK